MLAPQAPAWVMPGAKFDFDFANQRSWGGSINYGQCTNKYQGTAFIGPANGIPGYAPNRAGILIPFQGYQPRITDLGLFMDSDTVNNALWSRDLTNAVWVKSNATVAKTQIGADNSANAASLLTATAASATVLQTITLSSAPVLTSFWMKRVTGTGTVKITQDGGTTYTDVTAQLSTTAFTQVKTGLQTLTNPVIGVQLGTSGDAVIVDFAQCESADTGTLNTYASFPLYTTSAAVRRYSEENSFGTPGGGQPNDGYRLIASIMGSGKPWSQFIAYSGTPFGAGWLLASDGIANSSGGADGNTLSWQGATSPNTGNAGYGNLNKMVGVVNGSGSLCCLNGGAISSLGSGSYAFPSTNIGTHIGIGDNGSATSPFPLNGYISRIAFWDKELSNGQMIEFTR